MLMNFRELDSVKEQIGQKDKTARYSFRNSPDDVYTSHAMRKPVYAICEQQRRRSACASAA